MLPLTNSEEKSRLSSLLEPELRVTQRGVNRALFYNFASLLRTADGCFYLFQEKFNDMMY